MTSGFTLVPGDIHRAEEPSLYNTSFPASFSTASKSFETTDSSCYSVIFLHESRHESQSLCEEPVSTVSDSGDFFSIDASAV